MIILDKVVESLFCVLEMNVTLYVNCIKKNCFGNDIGWVNTMECASSSSFKNIAFWYFIRGPENKSLQFFCKI